MAIERPPPRGLIRAAKYLGLAYAVVLIAATLPYDALEFIPMSLPFYLWQLGPAIAAAALVRASRTFDAAIGFLALEVAIILSTAWAYAETLYFNPDYYTVVGSIVVVVFRMPFYQYVVLILCVVSALAMGWRPGRPWLQD